MTLASIGQDLRHTVRAAARTPGTTAVLLLSLALGTGANAAVYGVMSGLLLAAPPRGAGSGAPRQHLHERIQRCHARSVFLRRLPVTGVRDERFCGGGRHRRSGGRERDYRRRVSSRAHCSRLRLFLHAARHAGPVWNSAAGAGGLIADRCRRQLPFGRTVGRCRVGRRSAPLHRQPILHSGRRHAAALSGTADRTGVRCVDSAGSAPAAARQSPSRDRGQAGARGAAEQCRGRPATAVGRPR